MAFLVLGALFGPGDLLAQPADDFIGARCGLACGLQEQIGEMPVVGRPSFAGQRHEGESPGDADLRSLQRGEEGGEAAIHPRFVPPFKTLPPNDGGLLAVVA